jgi:oligoribonuclease
MPLIVNRFSYRNIDISTIKEVCRRLNPDLYKRLDEVTVKQEKHRALDDLYDTIEEFAFYKREFLLEG